MSQPEPTLIKQAQRGDQGAIQALYDQYRRHWFRVCLRYARNREEAEDMLQEGLMGVFRDIQQYDPKRGAFSTWSHRIMAHAALKYLKKHHWQQFHTEMTALAEEEDAAPSSTDTISAKELTRLIQQMPAGYRAVFNMYEIEGYSHQEIAQTLSISVGTSKSQLAKAKKALRQRLKALY